jgi:CAAX prenyl protease-like protein
VTPFIEELFVRSFLIRYLDVFDRGGHFREVPVGRFAWRSFLLTSLYFGFSHRPWEWPVAFPTGVLLNLWLYRRGQLGSVILAHAVANGAIWAVVVLGPGSLATRGGAALDPWIFL